MGNLEINNLSKYYDKKCVINECNLKIERKKFYTILGPSGSGKSTLLSCIAGIENPTMGVIKLDSKILYNDVNEINIVPNKRNIGFVFQNYALWPHMTVEKHLAFPLKAKKMDKITIKNKCSNIMNLLNLEDKIHNFPYQLSGGEQQRVALGRALIMEPELLLLDEPLSNLDALLREKMQYEIKSIQKKLDITTILVTHDQEEAKLMSDEVIVMNNGKIEQVGEFNDLVYNPQTDFVRCFIKRKRLYKMNKCKHII